MLTHRFVFNFMESFFSLTQTEYRKNEIKKSMKLAWDSYVTYALGDDYLCPQTLKGQNDNYLSFTLIDSLDSLLIMGLKEEFQEALNWLKKNMEFKSTVSFFEATIRCVGGLLSAYELSNEKFLLNLAEDLADRLIGAYSDTNGFPRAQVNLSSQQPIDYPWNQYLSTLADVGSSQLESIALTHYTGQPKFIEKSLLVQKFLLQQAKMPHNYLSYFNLITGINSYGFDAFGDSYYEYLAKTYIYSPKHCPECLEAFIDSMKAAVNKLSVTTRNGHFIFIQSTKETPDPTLSHLSFFLPGTLFLTYKEMKDHNLSTIENRQFIFDLASSLIETDQWIYDSTPTGLSGESFTFTSKGLFIRWNNASYQLRPEHVESLFYAWRVTHDVRMRNRAWKIFQAIQKYCNSLNGYTTISDVHTNVVILEDKQDSFFLSETLKYLYLIFCNDDYFSFDDYVFTTQAHPLKRIKQK